MRFYFWCDIIKKWNLNGKIEMINKKDSIVVLKVGEK